MKVCLVTQVESKESQFPYILGEEEERKVSEEKVMCFSSASIPCNEMGGRPGG